MDLSPDGGLALAFVAWGVKTQVVIHPTGSSEIQSMNLARGNLEQHHWATWFPDGKSILVCGNEPGKASRCYAQDLAGGNPRPVTPEGERGVVSPADLKSIVVWCPERKPVIYRLGEDKPEQIPGVTDKDVPIR